MSSIAIIPARGGSKRIPRKNIKDFLGKPIIAYSIEAAIKSELFDEVMVSTDDEEIAEIARYYGAKVPFFRSEKNAGDLATTTDVLLEVLEQYKSLAMTFETLCCIYPGAPFTTASKLKNAFEVLNSNAFDAVFPVIPFGFPIQRAVVFEDNKIGYLQPEYEFSRSQDLKQCYHDAGQFYVLNVNSLIQNKKIFTSNTGGIFISELEAQDIDNEVDWKLAEIKYQLQNVT